MFKSAKDLNYNLDEIIEVLKEQYKEFIDSMKISTWNDFGDFKHGEYKVLTVIFNIEAYQKQNQVINIFKKNPTNKKFYLEKFYLTNSVEETII